MDYWNSYWNESNRDTCLGNVSDFAMSHFDRFWEKAISSFSHQGDIKSNVECLDVACGNGVASSQVSKFMPDHTINFAGLDRADVNYALDNRNHDVTMFTGERFLDFFNASRKFDLVISNFGIEYLSIEEVERLLTEYVGGKTTFVFNMHDENSLVSKSSIKEIDAVNEFLNDDRLLSLEERLISNFQTELAKQYLTRLKVINDRNAQRIAGCGIADFIVSEFVQCQRENKQFCDFAYIKKTYTDYINRLSDQVRAAKNTEQLLELAAEIGLRGHTSDKIKDSNGRLISNFKVFRK